MAVLTAYKVILCKVTVQVKGTRGDLPLNPTAQFRLKICVQNKFIKDIRVKTPKVANKPVAFGGMLVIFAEDLTVGVVAAVVATDPEGSLQRSPSQHVTSQLFIPIIGISRNVVSNPPHVSSFSMLHIDLTEQFRILMWMSPIGSDVLRVILAVKQESAMFPIFGS